jgi:two-component system sensor histidine kinase DegS
MGQCLCGQCAQRGELIAVRDLNRTPEFARTPCGCEQFRAVLSVPVRAADRVVGVIHVASRKPCHFDAADRALLTSIGTLVGAAIEKAQLHAQLQALNLELEARVNDRTRELVETKDELVRKADALQQLLVEELRIEEKTRARIARDLHDGVQQLIVGALFETQAARDAQAVHPETAQARLAAAQGLLQRIGVEMRHAIYNLRPPTLDTHGLATALRECAASFERVSQVKCALQVEGTPRRFNPDAEVAAFRISQEVLNNIEAHAHAKQVTVRVRFGPRDLCVEIADDGKGFDVADITQEARTHLGLIGMSERAESVGGTVEVSSRVGQGTRVILTLPISRPV